MSLDRTLEDIGQKLNALLAHVSKLDKTVASIENEQKNSTEPSVPQVLPQQTFFPVEVTEVNSAAGKFTGQILKPAADTTSPYVHDTDLGTIEVHVTTPTLMPLVKDVMQANFTGTYGAGYTPIYGCFDQSLFVTGVSSTQTPTTVSPVMLLEFDAAFYVREEAAGHAHISLLSSISSPDTEQVTVVYDIRINGTDLEAKYVTLTVHDAGTPGSWQTIHSGTECTT
jgi:hypothetical protein